MRDDIHALYKQIKQASSDEETIGILNTILNIYASETDDWTKWELRSFVYNCTHGKKKCHGELLKNYAYQFIQFMCDGYLKIPKEYHNVDMFYELLLACRSFKQTYNQLYMDFFERDEWLLEWFITNPETALRTSLEWDDIYAKEVNGVLRCDLHNVPQDEQNEYFFIMLNFIKEGWNGKNISNLNIITKFVEEYKLFPALSEKCELLLKAAEEPLNENECIYLYEQKGYERFFFRCPMYFIKKKYMLMDDEEKPVNNWEVMLDENNPTKMTWCINYVMPFTCAKTQKKIGIKNLIKIFRYKRCQRALLNNKDMTYAMPEIIEFASKREHHDSLCVELKEILGYNTTLKNEEKLLAV